MAESELNILHLVKVFRLLHKIRRPDNPGIIS